MLDNPTDPRIQIILDRITDLEDKIMEVNSKVEEVDTKQAKQLKSSTFDFGAYIGIGIGAIALLFLFGLSVNHANGKTSVTYESSQTSKIVLALISTSSAVWGFNQHHKAKRERE